ncbi:MAG: Membrane protein insertase YidC [Firmicutes bacterium ADurb.Bin356]|nr:MAG: Membrane protein insertase YidC [Firmicutes bacterium ADurb.Bin356]
MQGDFFLTTWVLLGMRWLYENVTASNVVLTIVISTIIIRALTVFGDIQSRKSSIKMQAVQPDIDKLRKKYKDDPQKLQQAQAKLMRERGVSMWGGCLPMLLMMPLLFCFIAAFRFWGYEQMVKVLMELNETGKSELFNSFKFLWVNNIWQPDSGLQPVIMKAEAFLAIPKLSNLIYFKENPAALSAFEKLGFIISDVKNIPQSAIDTYNSLVAPIIKPYEGYTNGWFILPLLAGATTYLSSWVMQKNQPKPSEQAAAGGANMGKTMLYVMPVMSVVFCLTANSAFAVYWTISNIISLGVNLLLNRKFKKDAALGGEVL